MRFSGQQALIAFGVGQVASTFGTSLASFSLGVWVFQRTQSVAQFALVAILISVPSIFIRPIAGALVDRWDRRGVLIGSDALSALLTLATLALVSTDHLSVWFVYAITPIQTAATAFQLLASSAAIQLIVPPEQFGKASGAIGAVKSISTIFAPLMAGGLMATIGLSGILCLNLGTLVIGVSTVTLMVIPPVQDRSARAASSLLYDELKEGWAYLRGRRSFLILTSGAMLITAVFEVARVLLTPLVLGFAGPAVLGSIMAAAGVGVLLGNVLMLAWGGPRRRTHAILGGGFLIGVSLVLGGLRPAAVPIGGAVMAVMFGIPIVAISIEAIWLTKVPPTLIGRVKGATAALESVMATLVLLVAGVLADRVFEPLLVPGGPLAATVGTIIGVGTGRGVALMLIGVGLAALAVVSFAVLSPAVRLLEDAVPDVAVDDYLAQS
jgi:MFS transporter, DHA3 family, macrolide efflux protein